MPIPHRPKASLGCSSTNTKAVVARAKLMYSGLFTNVATFVSPTVALTAFLALITALESVQAATTTTKGLTTTRNAKRALVWSAMESLCAYVQSLADAVIPTEAVVLIKSAGLVVAEVAAHEKELLRAELTTTGTVQLRANATLLVGKKPTRHLTFNWQWSTDQSTWHDVHGTPISETTIPGLPLNVVCWFRVSVTMGKTTTPPCAAVSLHVH